MAVYYYMRMLVSTNFWKYFVFLEAVNNSSAIIMQTFSFRVYFYVPEKNQ